MECPRCGLREIVRNGNIHTGAQKYLCKECGRQFIENPRKKVISQETKDLIDKLLLEKLPLSAIARVTNVSEVWLQGHINKKYESIPKELRVTEKKRAS